MSARQTTPTPPTHLANQLLVALPTLKNNWFAKSVIYLFDHHERGAAGFVVNKPSQNVKLADILARAHLSPISGQSHLGNPVFDGGPLHPEQGFVLHEPTQAYDFTPLTPRATEEAGTHPRHGVAVPSDETFYATTLAVKNGLEITASRDIMEALAQGAGPRKIMLCCGYASWEAMQLEHEIARNDWLSIPASLQQITHLVFDTPVAERYAQALSLLGLQPWTLMASHAAVV